MTDVPLVTIRTFLNRIDAELAAGALEAAGIQALVRPDDCGGMRPHLWSGGVELLVRADDVEMAELALRDRPLADADDVDDGEDPDDLS